MEQVEYWIWEHAMKYGMTKVLERIHTKYEKSLIPNSWISALFLQQIMNSWESSKNMITFNEVNSLRQLLSSTYKHYKESIASILETKHFVKFDLVLRATFLVLRSSKSDSVLVKKRAINELFPVWNVLHWERIKKNFYIKDDLLQTDVEQLYSQLRSWLAQESSNKEIITTFDTLMKQYSPVLITFMRSIKLSVLERIQAKNVAVPAHLEFIPQSIAQSSLIEEVSVLGLYDLFCQRKFNFIGSNFLNLKKSLHPGGPQSVLKSSLFSLPPEIHPSLKVQPYPSCFQSHPSMPSCVLLKFDNSLQKMPINRSFPRTKSGTPIEPFWFATITLVDPKPDIVGGESEENGQSKTADNVSPQKRINNTKLKVATTSALQIKDDKFQTKSEKMISQIASKRSLDSCEQANEGELIIRETESKCYENQFPACRRKSEPAKPCEADKAAEENHRPKRPRYTSVDGFEAERTRKSLTKTTRLYTQTSEQLSIVTPIEPIPDRSIADDEMMPTNVKATATHVELSSQPCSKGQRLPSVWKLVQELSGHSRQLQKLGEDNERGYLNSFLNRLRRYRSNAL